MRRGYGVSGEGLKLGHRHLRMSTISRCDDLSNRLCDSQKVPGCQPSINLHRRGDKLFWRPARQSLLPVSTRRKTIHLARARLLLAHRVRAVLPGLGSRASCARAFSRTSVRDGRISNFAEPAGASGGLPGNLESAGQITDPTCVFTSFIALIDNCACDC
jgi:hypothetical protein